jgi:hypothetical protein
MAGFWSAGRVPHRPPSASPPGRLRSRARDRGSSSSTRRAATTSPSQATRSVSAAPTARWWAAAARIRAVRIVPVMRWRVATRGERAEQHRPARFPIPDGVTSIPFGSARVVTWRPLAVVVRTRITEFLSTHRFLRRFRLSLRSWGSRVRIAPGSPPFPFIPRFIPRPISTVPLRWPGWSRSWPGRAGKLRSGSRFHGQVFGPLGRARLNFRSDGSTEGERRRQARRMCGDVGGWLGTPLCTAPRPCDTEVCQKNRGGLSGATKGPSFRPMGRSPPISETTMIYTHVTRSGPNWVKRPADRL